MKMQKLLLALTLLVVYPMIADVPARAETPHGATRESLPQPYRAAIEVNDPDVMYLTGLMFDLGEGVPRDYREAFRWYVLAAEAGQRGAMNSLGLMYAMGHGVAQDHSEAMKWWTMAADRGSATALANIAATYYAGIGVERNYSEAAKWFQLAADKGGAEAMNMLGTMYAEGLGVARDRRNANNLFRQSANLGSPSAMVNLGTLYAAGRGVKHDDALAYAWLVSALAVGVPAEVHDGTIYKLGTIAARLGPNQRSRAQEHARRIAEAIAGRQPRAPDRKPDPKYDQARLGSTI